VAVQLVGQIHAELGIAPAIIEETLIPIETQVAELADMLHVQTQGSETGTELDSSPPNLFVRLFGRASCRRWQGLLNVGSHDIRMTVVFTPRMTILAVTGNASAPLTKVRLRMMRS
jgi:hypothetical protein